MAQRTWTYVYQDSQGKRHEGEMAAPNKDEVYAALRQQGIRAQRVTERVQPIVKRGFRGLRVRDWCIISVCVLGVLTGVAYFAFSGNVARPPKGTATAQEPALKIIGRKGTIESPVVSLADAPRRALPRPRRALARAHRDLSSIFTHPSERLLAMFAEPGRPVRPVTLTSELKEDLVDALETDILIQPTDEKDVVALKRIVAGMKDDVLELIGAGLSIEEVFYRYAERQRMEVEYRVGLLRVLKAKGDLSAVNARLAAVGMAPVEEGELRAESMGAKPVESGGHEKK